MVRLNDVNTCACLTHVKTTVDGRPKIVDLIDTSGSGDVDTSTVRKALCNGIGPLEIVGLTGRTLKIPEQWRNPTGEWHVGMKAGFELFPVAVRGRLQVSEGLRRQRRLTIPTQCSRLLTSSIVCYDAKKKFIRKCVVMQCYFMWLNCISILRWVKTDMMCPMQCFEWCRYGASLCAGKSHHLLQSEQSYDTQNSPERI